MSKGRRKRSELSRDDCLLVLEFFAKRVKRFASWFEMTLCLRRSAAAERRPW